ncbi:MAG: hypothetical protein E7Y34_01125, partial [Mycoplasma sp.]|nr:hypothetical protein [Mycoplasma sp.]
MTNNKKKVVLILGAFDGFHNGHLNLINKAKSKYQDHKIYITIFDFNNVNFHKKITQYCQYPIKEKQAKLLNIDKVIKVNFKTVCNLDGLIWIKKIISEYKPDVIMVGKDFAFGKDRKYKTTDLLK